MRFIGIGLLVFGVALFLGAAVAEESGARLTSLILGGFMFLSGAVFAASAGIQDAIRRKA